MSTAKKVSVISATRNLHTGLPKAAPVKRKVAGYARVSTDSEEQQTSYEAQVDYYTKFIRSKPEWEFAGVYTDEGISALNTRHRDGFNSMITDALAGDIDLIITKSVSRFARNTVDSLTTVRKLKEHGVEVYFQKENDSKGEFLITIMPSLAQEESRSISENVTWGQRKWFADGKVSLPYRKFLGYEKGPDGLPRIVESEAETVRQIYLMFMDGKTPGAIARALTATGTPTPAGKKKWQGTTVESILTNEKYKGAALLQEKFTVDFLTKKIKPNEGEVPQYYVENSHPAIIQPDEFERVQHELARRKAKGGRTSCASPFSGKIICADYGGFFTPKVWHSNDRYRRVIWQCADKYKHEASCQTPHLYEKEIQELFIRALSELLKDRDAILADCRLLQDTLGDCAALDAESKELLREMDVVEGLTRQCIAENAASPIDQTEFMKRYNGYVEWFNTLKVQYDTIQTERTARQDNLERIGGFMFVIRELDTLPIVFDEKLWNAMVDHVTVHDDERVVFTFQCGKEISEQL